MENMVIGFDAKRVVCNATGLGSYGRTLVNSLSRQIPQGTSLRLYTPSPGREDLRAGLEMRPCVSLVLPARGHSRLRHDLWRMHGIVRDLKADGVQLFHGLSGELPKGLRKAGIKGLVTIHDLIFLRHPEYYNRADVAIYRHKFHATLKEADRIIAISECTKRDILHYGDFPEDRIDVIYQSCGTSFAGPVAPETLSAVKQKHSLPENFILYVGTVEERKNAGLAVEAMKRLPNDLSLVVVGRLTGYGLKVRKAAADAGLGHRVHFLGSVPYEDLPALYHMAQCFVYPSRYEGFGIPVIEAIQCGLPVVACTGSCLEEAGGPYSLYVDPDDPDALAQAISSMLPGAPGREERISQSRQYVRRFENSDVASQMFAEYSKLI